MPSGEHIGQGLFESANPTVLKKNTKLNHMFKKTPDLFVEPALWFPQPEVEYVVYGEPAQHSAPQSQPLSCISVMGACSGNEVG